MNINAFKMPTPIHIFVSRSPRDSRICFGSFIYVTPLFVFGMFPLQTSFEFETSLTTYLLNNIQIIIPIRTVFNTVNPINHRTVSNIKSTVRGLSSVHILENLRIMQIPRQECIQIQSLFRIPHFPLPFRVMKRHHEFCQAVHCKAHKPSSFVPP